MIGVIGGMGPLATVDFIEKVIDEANAVREEDHVPLLVNSDPRIPSRPAAILDGGASPLPALLCIRDRLLHAGVAALVMPCNTAHHWHGALTLDCPVPFISIVDAGCDEVRRVAATGAAIAVLSTRATQAARLFDAPLAASGFRRVELPDAEIDRLVLPAIAAVKSGRIEAAAALLDEALELLSQQGVSHVLLACTELPIALRHSRCALAARCIDATRVLARATVAWWRGNADALPLGRC